MVSFNNPSMQPTRPNFNTPVSKDIDDGFCLVCRMGSDLLSMAPELPPAYSKALAAAINVYIESTRAAAVEHLGVQSISEDKEISPIHKWTALIPPIIMLAVVHRAATLASAKPNIEALKTKLMGLFGISKEDIDMIEIPEDLSDPKVVDDLVDKLIKTILKSNS